MSVPAPAGDGHEHSHSTWRSRMRHAVTPHSHDPVEQIQAARSSQETSREGIRAAWIGLAGMTVTALLQIVIVAISGSVGLLADTLHNVGHAVTTIPLIIAFRLGQRAPTARYPYGYRRAEDLVGLLIAVVIAISAVIIIVESVRALVDPRELTNIGWVFAAGIVGAIGNELVAVYRIRIGRRIGSAALVAEGQHARVDGLSSIAVALGMVGAWLGFGRADAIVGLGIAAVILAILWSSLRTTVRRLMDGVDPPVLARIAQVAGGVPGVITAGQVRARWLGHRLEADLTIGVDATLDVLAAHRVAQDVHHALVHGVGHLDNAVVHVEPAPKRGAEAEPRAGLEPATFALQEHCSTN